MIRKLACMLIGLIAMAASCLGGVEGLWGGKWDDKWPVFIEIKPGADAQSYQLEYIWLENLGNRDFSHSTSEAKKINGHFESGKLIFSLDEATGMLYGAFRKPRMANLVRITTKLPAPEDYNRVLQEHGWKPGAIPAFEAQEKIQAK